MPATHITSTSARTYQGLEQSARPNRLYAAILLAISHNVAGAVAVEDTHNEPNLVDFNTSFTGSSIDLTRFQSGNRLAPGAYRVDLHVNGKNMGRETVQFRESGAQTAVACFSVEQLNQLGLDISRVDADRMPVGNDCTRIENLVPDASARLNPNALRLDISIPQISLRRRPRGYIEPSLWDRGTTAGTVGYSMHAYRSVQRSQSSGKHVADNVYVGLDNGLNVAGWRVRHRASAQWRSGSSTKWQGVGMYAQHDVTRMRAQLTVGDSFTSGRLFESTGFRGVNLATDDRMRPDGQNGFAPVVRGVARTQAQITIKQNGYLLREQTVAPGEFEIDDLNATGFGGDLLVTVTESDGSFHTFEVPYASVPQLMRPGTGRFEMTAGQLRTHGAKRTPYLLEGTYQYGVNNHLTLYGGLQITHDASYRGSVLGGAFNSPIGAVSLDLLGASAKIGGQPRQGGYSVRLSYAKSIPLTGTNLALASYRYASGRHVSLANAVDWNDQWRRDPSRDWAKTHSRPRVQTQLTINQPLGGNRGSLFITGSHRSHHGTGDDVTTYNAGYSGRIRRVGYSVSASRTTLPNGRRDNQYYLSVNAPLGLSSARRTTMLNSSVTRDSQGQHHVRLGVNGSLGDRMRGSYGLHASHTPGHNQSDSAGANLSWSGSNLTAGGSYSRGRNIQQASLSAAGSVVVHGGGITLAPRLGDTIAIIEAKGAKGARINGSTRIDGRGYGVISSLTPYRQNEISIDPRGISTDVEFLSTRQQITPRAGAVVRATFDTKTGRSLLIRALRDNGDNLPFGAQVFDEAGSEVGVVGQGGQMFVRTLKEAGSLNVRWGEAPADQCHVTYNAVLQGTAGSLHAIQALCNAAAAGTR